MILSRELAEQVSERLKELRVFDNDSTTFEEGMSLFLNGKVILKVVDRGPSKIDVIFAWPKELVP